MRESMLRFSDGWWVPAGRHLRDARHPITSQIGDLGSIDMALKHARLEPGWQCVQAGARVGLWPIVLAQRGAAHVHAFEPDPINCECARRNVADRQLAERVAVRHSALGPREQQIFFSMSKESGGEHHVGKGKFSILVPQTTIDSLALQQCAAIFLDVEGYDLEVLRGAVETLKRCKPIVAVEENALCMRYARERGDVARFLGDYGYRLVDEFSTLSLEEQNDGIFHGSDLIFAVP